MKSFETPGRALVRPLLVITLILSAVVACRPVMIDELPEKGVDGTWVLTTVNSQAVASLNPGYPIPGSANFLRTGRLNLATVYTVLGRLHYGWIDAVYSLRDAQARSLPSQTYAGQFRFNRDRQELTLFTDKGEVVGKVDGNTLTFVQSDLPLIGTATIVFRR